MGSPSPLPRRTAFNLPHHGARCASQQNPRRIAATGHVWTVPAVQEESDYSAKRSGAVMYSACFRLEACLRDDATTMAAGRDVIR
jgi:hypothetical protein